jgi:DNA polymerase III subunit gamma/tau
MPSLIAQRPMTWNEVVGQARGIEVLQAALRNQRFLSRGIILHGVVGVGKTTVAYLAAKALMCTGENFLGCGECPSCLLIQSDGIDKHPDFIEIDGAVKPGVEGARDTIESTLTLPVLGKRRVTVIDEAHWLSAEAWSAYLKTLESGETDSIFLFVSQDYGKIQNNIRSRCIRIAFDRVSQDVLVGHLANVASKNDIAADLDALKLIARQANGIVRDAVQYLNTCGALGVRVDTKTVRNVIDTTLDDMCERLLQTIAARDQVGAIKLADALVRKEMPGKVAERMLSLYSRAIYTEDPELRKIYLGLPDVSAVAGVLIKWAAVQHAPADIVTIIVFELLKTQSAVRAHSAGAVRPNPQPTVTVPPARQKSSLEAMLDDDEVV